METSEDSVETTALKPDLYEKLLGAQALENIVLSYD